MDWIKSRPRLAWLCFYLSAAVTGLTLVFPQIGFLEWISMIPMLVIVFSQFDDSEMSAKQCYWRGFWAVYTYYFVIYHWFVNLYPLDFVGLDNGASVVVVLAGWLGLSLLQALPGGLVFLGFQRLCRGDFIKKHPVLKLLAFACLWILFEWSSTLTWAGVPWGRLYMGQCEYLPMLQSASLFGSYVISLLILVVNGLVAYAVCYRCKELLCYGLSAGLIVGNLSFGLIRTKSDFQTENTVCAAVAQGNISSHEKWEDSTTFRMMDVYEDLTQKAAADGAELVIWPETTITVALNRSRAMKNFVTRVAKENQITLIVGALYEDETGEYNSLFLIESDGTISEQRYNKRHLVPFGEYVPLRKLVSVLIPPLAELSALELELTPGEDSALLETAWGKVGSMICFDSIYEMLGIQSVRDGAELMVISSNDSWFKDSKAIYQHQIQAQFRAIEQGKYLLRSANTGISTILTPTGEILSRIDPLVEGYLVEQVSIRTRDTLYSVIGNTLVYLCGGFCLFVAASDIVAKKKKGKEMTEAVETE